MVCCFAFLHHFFFNEGTMRRLINMSVCPSHKSFNLKAYNCSPRIVQRAVRRVESFFEFMEEIYLVVADGSLT